MGASWLYFITNDLRASARALRGRLGYAAMASFTLALGVGGSVVVYSIVDAVAYAEMPYRDSGGLVAVYERSLADPDIDRWAVAPANYLDWQASLVSIEEVAAYDWASPLMTTESASMRPRGILVSAGLFELLGARAERGRLIGAADVEAEAAVAVISDGLWKRAFGGDADIVGREIVLDRVTTTIVGVMPPAFRFPFSSSIEIWRPLVLTPEDTSDRSTPTLFVVGRLAPGFEIEQAREEVGGIASALGREYPETNGDRGVTVVTLREDWLEWRRPALMIFIGAAGLALAIGCINLAGLMLSRGLTRLEELSVRKALGAGRGRVASVVLSEGLIIAAAGTVGGALVALVALPLLLRVAPDGWGGALLDQATVDLAALAAAVVLAFVTAIVSSLAPILAAWHADPIHAIRANARAAGGLGQMRVRRALVVLQTVLAVFLLAQAGLLARSMVRTFTYDVGFDYTNVLSARVLSDIEGEEEKRSFYATLAEEVGMLPGVEAAWIATIAPLTGFGAPVTVSTDGSEPGAMDAEQYQRRVEYRGVDPRHFDTLRIPLLRGRLFDAASTAGSERVAVVSQRFVDEVFGGETPLGASIRASLSFGGGLEGFEDPMRVIGVVGDIAEWGLWSEPPMIFVPISQARTDSLMNVMIKTEVPPETLIEPLRAVVWDLGNRLPLERVGTLESHHRELYGMHEFLLFIVAVFAVLAVVLAGVGLYGVIALQVSGRRRELAVRLALGATGRKIIGHVLREGVMLSAVGVLVAAVLTGATAPWMAASWIGNFLHGLDAFDPLSFLLAAALLLVTAFGASLLPARRAAGVDPARALRSES